VLTILHLTRLTVQQARKQLGQTLYTFCRPRSSMRETYVSNLTKSNVQVKPHNNWSFKCSSFERMLG